MIGKIRLVGQKVKVDPAAKRPVTLFALNVIAMGKHLTDADAKLLRQMREDADPGSFAIRKPLFPRLASEERLRFYRLAPLLFSIEGADPKKPSIALFGNRAWAIVDCENPRLAAEVFASLKPRVVRYVVARLVHDAEGAHEYSKLRPIFEEMNRIMEDTVDGLLRRYYDPKNGEYAEPNRAERLDVALRQYKTIMASEG
jgi:hypothetical protein